MPETSESEEEGKFAASSIPSPRPSPPRDFVVWLRDIKNVSKPTERTYVHEVRHFLGFVVKRMKRVGRLEDCWNIPLCQKFFDSIVPDFSPATITNYHAALAVVREFLLLQGRRPSNYMEIKKTFQLLNKSARKKKRLHLLKLKAKRSTKSMLAKFYQDIYHNDAFWTRFQRIILEVKAKKKRGEIVNFSRKDTSFATSFMLCIASASNFKRTGNLALWPLESTRSALNNALTTYRKKNPSTSISSLPRRLDPQNCVPAIIEVPVSAKKNEFERFCIANPRDQRALLEYDEYIRKFLGASSTCDLFFVNGKGHSVVSTVGFYFGWLGRRVGLPELTLSSLRAELETENSLTTNQSEKVSLHLGHSQATAEQYYISRGKRHAVEASLHMLFILEECGEKNFHDAPASAWDPVSALADDHVFYLSIFFNALTSQPPPLFLRRICGILSPNLNSIQTLLMRQKIHCRPKIR